MPPFLFFLPSTGRPREFTGIFARYLFLEKAFDSRSISASDRQFPLSTIEKENENEIMQLDL